MINGKSICVQHADKKISKVREGEKEENERKMLG